MCCVLCPVCCVVCAVSCVLCAVCCVLCALERYKDFLICVILRALAPQLVPVLRRPPKYVISPIFCTQSATTIETPLPVYFSCTTFRRSATTSATLLIPKCTTRRWSLRCSNYIVAKRQQFSCALSTATSSLNFENVVPEGWTRFFPSYLKVIFLWLYEHVHTSTSHGIF